MAVIVTITGENDQSDEYLAAKSIEEMIKKSIPQTAMGEIVLCPKTTLFGQSVKDVDILMLGTLHNYSAKVEFLDKNGNVLNEVVYLEEFCTTIEVKSHSITGVRRRGTNIEVKYPTGWHSATEQSNQQKNSTINYFKSVLGESPFITNVIYFTEINENELSGLLSNAGKVIRSNALPCEFSFDKITQLLAYQREPRLWNKCYHINAGLFGKDPNLFAQSLKFFTKVKSEKGELTRKRIEQISSAEMQESEGKIKNNELNIFRGKAGTGKTICLLKTAVRMVDENDSRVLLLTYNRALVSDIRRLLALADLPDMFNYKCVSINTMQSYFYGLINGCLYNGTLSGEDFLKEYEEKLEEMINFLKSDETAKTIVKELCAEKPSLNWEYAFIDEAQDWSSQERDLILELFPSDRIMVADGGMQFVRKIEPCDWNIVPERNSIKLKTSLRQKRNVVKFINAYVHMKYGVSEQIKCSNEMYGGRVIITCDKYVLDVSKKELNLLKEEGNISYDYLFLTPSTLVGHKGDESFFKNKKDFEKAGILLWDGTSSNTRLEYPIDLDVSRVLQYESARGLEGWTVCCMGFDAFISSKESQYDPNQRSDLLLLESAEEKKKKYMLNWTLIPMTRAIDTLILSVSSFETEEGKLLMQLSKEYPDYIRLFNGEGKYSYE